MFPLVLRFPAPHLHFDLVVSVAQVLQVGGGVRLHRREVMLQHVDHLRKFGVAPRKFPETDKNACYARLKRVSMLKCQKGIKT